MLKWFDRLRKFGTRRPLALATASAAVFGAFVVLWLSVATQTALLSNRLEMLDQRRFNLDREITELQVKIGDVTRVQVIESRMQTAGFMVPEKTVYLRAALSYTYTYTSTYTTALPAMSTIALDGGAR